MTGLLIFFAAIGGLAVLGLLLLATWLVASGEPLPDEPAVLDVQNHIGD